MRFVAIILTMLVLSKEVLNNEFDEEYPFPLFVEIKGFDLNDEMINVSDSCMDENPGTNISSVYNLKISVEDLNEPTKCYMECILVSIGTLVDNKLRIESLKSWGERVQQKILKQCSFAELDICVNGAKMFSCIRRIFIDAIPLM